MSRVVATVTVSRSCCASCAAGKKCSKARRDPPKTKKESREVIQVKQAIEIAKSAIRFAAEKLSEAAMQAEAKPNFLRYAKDIAIQGYNYLTTAETSVVLTMQTRGKYLYDLPKNFLEEKALVQKLSEMIDGIKALRKIMSKVLVMSTVQDFRNAMNQAREKGLV